jgi:hypothetical protein
MESAETIVAWAAGIGSPHAVAMTARGDHFKEQRNPSADAHGQPMSGGKPLLIVTSWAWAIRYRPSLCQVPSVTFLSCAQRVREARWASGGGNAEPQLGEDPR